MTYLRTSIQLGGRPEVSSEPAADLLIPRETRYPAENIEGRVGGFEVASVVNISPGGVAVETDKYLRVGKAYPLKFKRPSGFLSLQAAVVWSQLIRTVADKHEVRPVYMAGFKFSDMTATLRRELEEFILDEVIRTASAAGISDVS